jgi:hypothetical protein
LDNIQSFTKIFNLKDTELRKKAEYLSIVRFPNHFSNNSNDKIRLLPPPTILAKRKGINLLTYYFTGV